MDNLDLHVLGLWEETGVPRENPRRQWGEQRNSDNRERLGGSNKTTVLTNAQPSPKLSRLSYNCHFSLLDTL